MIQVQNQTAVRHTAWSPAGMTPLPPDENKPHPARTPEPLATEEQHTGIESAWSPRVKGDGEKQVIARRQADSNRVHRAKEVNTEICHNRICYSSPTGWWQREMVSECAIFSAEHMPRSSPGDLLGRNRYALRRVVFSEPRRHEIRLSEIALERSYADSMCDKRQKQRHDGIGCECVIHPLRPDECFVRHRPQS